MNAAGAREMSNLYIVNPSSGGGKGALVQRRLEELRSDRSLRPLAGEIVQIGAGLPLTRATLEGYERIIIAGGDGSVSRLLPELLNLGVPVGILPLGTGNDLARQLGLRPRHSIDQQLRVLLSAERRELAVWRLRCGGNNEVLFCNYASAGLDAGAAAAFDAWRANRSCAGTLLSRLMYVRFALPRLGCRICSGRISSGLQTAQLDGEGCCSILFSNIRPIAGVAHANAVSDPFDRLIEVRVVRSVWQYLPMLSPWAIRHFNAGLLDGAPSWRLEGLPRDAVWQVDGEPRAGVGGADFTIEWAGSMSVLCAARPRSIMPVASASAHQ